MRRIGLLGIAVLASLAATTAAQAANELNLRFEQPSTVLNPCTSELVDTTVGIHIVVNATTNDNNTSGTFHLDFHAQGVGQTTGARYTGSETDNESFVGSFENGRFVSTVVNTFILTTPGGSNNWWVSLVSHITINANGDVTASFETLKTDLCK